MLTFQQNSNLSEHHPVWEVDLDHLVVEEGSGVVEVASCNEVGSEVAVEVDSEVEIGVGLEEEEEVSAVDSMALHEVVTVVEEVTAADTEDRRVVGLVVVGVEVLVVVEQEGDMAVDHREEGTVVVDLAAAEERSAISLRGREEEEEGTVEVGTWTNDRGIERDAGSRCSNDDTVHA